MPKKIFQQSLKILFKRQTNILSAAAIIMVTIIFSQVLGLIRQRLLVSIFGASDTLGVYIASARLPDLLFQLIIVGALSSAFIPIFSDFLSKDKKEEACKMASTLLVLGLIIFSIIALIIFINANYLSSILAPGFSDENIELMANLTRVIIFGQMLFIIGSFLSAILQSYNHFFVPGIAASLYNLGIIISILLFAPVFGIFSAAIGVILGAFIFVIVQIPYAKKFGFSFVPSLSIKVKGVLDVFKLMWPRTISIAVFQLGTIITLTLISFLPSPGRNYVIFDYAQTLAFAPTVLFGQAIAQAAFPVLSREKDRIDNFKSIFLTSFSQLFYLILPFSVLMLVLRIPIVRLIYGAGQFDWQATVLTGRTLAFFSISIFAQALVYLVSRAFYALQDSKTPLAIGALSTATMISLGVFFIFFSNLGIESIAFSYSIANILNLVVLLIFLDRKTGGFQKIPILVSLFKIFVATICTGFALYVPIKLLDQLVFDTTRTINLLFLTGISSLAGLSLYLFLTWLFDVKEAKMFILLFKKIGDWRQVLSKTEEPIEVAHINH